ncbi:MAG: ABC transporter permease [Saccharofermentans sp.]|jgi:ABC-2 type transport system permease protein|nr:ABC transporter permease [Saccharofermentans sp.]
MLAIYKRELASYFRSPVGYIALALFSFLSGFVFINQYGDGSVNISSEIMSLCSFFVVIVPVITMGLFSEDKKRGTEVLFYTNPLSMFDVVLGKFFAAMTLIAILFSNVFLHMIITAFSGGVVNTGTWGSVIVYFCLAILFTSIGILASALTDTQIISAIISFVIILVIQLLQTISTLASSALGSVLSSSMLAVEPEKVNKICNNVAAAITWLSPFTKTADFRYGVFSISPLVFCLSMALVFLFLTYRILEKKRWSQN